MNPMQITCPRCGAIYEIDAELIPASGRDVQCASCSHVWIQTRRGEGNSAEVGSAVDRSPIREEEPMPVVDPSAGAAGARSEGEPGSDATGATVPQVGGESEPEDDDDGDGSSDSVADAVSSADPTQPGSDAPRRRPDEETLRILREEAALAAARRTRRREEDVSSAPGGPPEAPPVSPAPSGGAAVPARPDRDEAPRPIPASLRPEPKDHGAPRARPAPAVPSGPGETNELLPDIDEINSSLSGNARNTAPARDGPRPPLQRRRWPAAVLVVILVVALVVVLLYVAAPWVTARVPALDAPLTAVVDAIDALRTSAGTGPGA